jgi:hypothetical protein
MISRLTASAAVFAILVTTGLAFAADGQSLRAAATPTASATAMPTITLPRVEITGHRQAAR